MCDKLERDKKRTGRNYGLHPPISQTRQMKSFSRWDMSGLLLSRMTHSPNDGLENHSLTIYKASFRQLFSLSSYAFLSPYSARERELMFPPALLSKTQLQQLYALRRSTVQFPNVTEHVLCSSSENQNIPDVPAMSENRSSESNENIRRSVHECQVRLTISSTKLRRQLSMRLRKPWMLHTYGKGQYGTK
jgi:hypothetical protein